MKHLGKNELCFEMGCTCRRRPFLVEFLALFLVPLGNEIHTTPLYIAEHQKYLFKTSLLLNDTASLFYAWGNVARRVQCKVISVVNATTIADKLFHNLDRYQAEPSRDL